MNKKLTANRNFQALLLLTPAMIFIFFVFLYPITLAFRMSFSTDRIFKFGNMGPLTLGNYSEIFSNMDFWLAFKNTLFYMLGTTSLSCIIGIVLALFIDKLIFGKRIIRTFLGFPWVIPPAIAALVWKWIFEPHSGILNQFLYSMLGVSYSWLTDPNTAMSALIITGVWHEIPYFLITCTAGLQMVDQELFDAASIDGASSWQNFKYITIPSISQILGIAIVMSSLTAFREYDTIAVMTNGGPAGSTTTLAVLIYKNAFQYFQMGYASTIGMISFIICIILVFLFLRSTVKEFN